MNTKTPLLELKGIEKGFYGVPVLKGIDLSFYEGECVSLIGENGAGKSTLIKILCGVYNKDAGSIYMNGKEISIQNADEAKKMGISVIYQELSLFSDLTVYENIFINNEITHSKNGNKLAPLSIKTMKEEAKKVLNDKLKIDIDINSKVKDIPFSQRQMVEIGRAVYTNSQIIIMDEPTTALEIREKKVLFEIIDELRSQGKMIIFISHHLDEIFANCDRTIVLRDGNVVLEKLVRDLTEEELIQAMIGKNVDNYYPKVNYDRGETLLTVSGLSKKGVFNNITFDVKKKEIVGIVGLAGCGKYEIVRSIFGIHSYDEGNIRLNGKLVRNKTVPEAMKNKFAFLPAERKVESLFTYRDISWNTTIAQLEKINSKKGLDLIKEKEITANYIKDLNIKVTTQTQTIASLSGGNQQKVILSRWFLSDPDVLILEEPTRGIDVNAKTEVYNLIMKYVAQDKGVVLVSSEEEEVFGICDRIIIIHNGEITGILNKEDTTLEHIKTLTKFNKSEDDD